jgi:hypothetical protein
MSSAETMLKVRVSVNEPATLHWAITYEDVSAEFRYHLLGFKSSLLSADQVLAVSAQADPGAHHLAPLCPQCAGVQLSWARDILLTYACRIRQERLGFAWFRNVVPYTVCRLPTSECKQSR